MKSRTIAYFDILGYKEFIFSENPNNLSYRIGHVMRDIEHSLTLDAKGIQEGGWLYADFSMAKANVHFISDTIIFYSDGDSHDEMIDVLLVAHSFNSKINKLNFPARGCVLFGEMEVIQNLVPLESGNSYSITCPYGKGLIKAHLNAEDQSWAATIVDSTIINRIRQSGINTFLIEEYSTWEKVPRKEGSLNAEYEFVFKLIKNTGQDAFDHTKSFLDNLIFKVDSHHFKSSARVQEIYRNTLDLCKRQILGKRL